MPAVHWFEIAVTDIKRAQAFYAKVLGVEVPIVDMTEQMGSMLGVLPHGGQLVQNAQHGYQPSDSGTLLYLTVEGNLDTAVNRVTEAGGDILLPKTPLPEGSGGGFITWIKDLEGNKIGLFAKE